jgi:hypothetical protein
VHKNTPEAFDYSMFAATGIDIHHHNDAYLSPQILTNKVHSNGYVKIDYSSEFYVEKLSTAGALTLPQDGGTYPGGAIPTTGYSWWNPQNGRCYPGNFSAASSASCVAKYSGHATVTGQIEAGSITVGSRGNTLPGSGPAGGTCPLGRLTETGVCIPQTFGDVKVGTAKIGATTYTEASAPGCAQCNKGAAAAGGQLGGKLTVQPGFAPKVIPYPSIDYSTTYRVRPSGASTGDGTTNVFGSEAAFLSYIANPANGLFRTVNPTTGALSAWTYASGKMPGALYLNGIWDITAGDVTLKYDELVTAVRNGIKIANPTSTINGVPPVLLIKGSLIAETGKLDIQTPLVIAGRGNRMDVLKCAAYTTGCEQPSVDSTKFLDAAATEPGLLAAGKTVDASDYDTDPPWTSVSTYEPLKASPIYVRGVIYSGKWNAATESSDATDQHWHTYDAKNTIKLYGAQIGGKLHDCNNFWFTYDPIVKNIFGFGDGSKGVEVLDFQDIPNPPS